jgi:hypothetical protein
LTGFALAMPERFSRPVFLACDNGSRLAAGDTAAVNFWQTFSVGTSSSTPSQVFIDVSCVVASIQYSATAPTLTITPYQLGVNTTTQTYEVYFEGVFDLV